MRSVMRSTRLMLGRNQVRIAILVLLLVCIYFIVVFAEQAWHANRLEAEIAQQRASIADIRNENAGLATRAEEMNSPAYNDYVEMVARRDLGMVRPGETVVIVPHQSTFARPTPQPLLDAEPPKQNWQRWIDAVFDRDAS